MTHQLHTFQITVTLKAPWLVQGNDPASYGLDAVQLVGPDGARILPGTLLTGRLREAWNLLRTQLGSALVPDPAAWFGQEAVDRLEPSRSRIWVDDLVEKPQSNSAAYWPAVRVGLSDITGAGKEGMLQFIEQREPPGTQVVFEGVWRAVCTPKEAETLVIALSKGLGWYTQLGALRSVGFGELVAVTVKNVPHSQPAQTPETVQAFVKGAPAQDKLAARGLLLRFRQPLCVSTRTINGNTFVSGDVVPGSAIKGALATLLRAQGQAIPTWFDALRITHALPAHDQTRPAPLPLSLVALEAGGTWCIWDALRTETALSEGRALPYQSDWKPAAFAAAANEQGWGQTRRHLRVRTAMKGGRAKDNALFAYDCVLATPDTTEHTTCWLAHVDLGAQDSPENWQALASILQHGLLGPIGKTDAFAELQLLPRLESKWPAQLPNGHEPHDQELTVLLVSDALLFATPNVVGHTSAKPVDIHALYEQAFQNMAAQCLKDRKPADRKPAPSLLGFHATQRLAGGRYLHARRRPSGSGYQPYVLTEAGSVFRLRFAESAHAREVAQAWLAQGLPLPQAVATEHGADWTTNTYIPQNGWGEVLINPAHGFQPLNDETTQTQERTTP